MDNKEEVKTTETKTVDTGKKNPFRAVNVEDKTTSTKTPEVSAPVTEVKKEEERIDVSRDLDEHLKENEDKIRYKINFKDVLAVIILFIIVIACVFLIVDFFDKHSYLFKASTTTTTRGIFKTTTTAKYAIVKASTTRGLLVEDVFLPLIAIIKDKIITPKISSKIALETIVVPALPLNTPSSFRVATVIETLVAVKIVP